jgi:hypothetical protein
VRDGDIDDILKKAAEAQPDPDPALLDRIAASIQPNTRPVRPLPPPWVLACGLGLIGAATAIIVAALLGFHGIHAMNDIQAVIFVGVAGLAGRAAMAWTAEMIPGSRRQEGPAALLALSCALLVALFAILFRDDLAEHFVSQGMACLKAGLMTAAPVGVAGWWLLRRGFAVNPASAALAAGTLAGLAGVAMLELHCPNFQTWHVLIWHTAVVPVSASVAVLAVRLARRLSPARG